MQRGIRGYVVLLVALLLVGAGCASSRDPTMARIFEAPNVIHVCVRPPNVPNDERMWALDANGSPVFEAREVDLARRAGLGVYIWDEGAPRESAKLLPIPYHRLECPTPPKPRAAAAKVEAGKGEESKKAEAEEAKRPKPQPQPIPRETSAVERRVEAQRCTAYAEPGQTRRRSGSGARTCTRVLVHRGHTEQVVAESPREIERPARVRLSEEAARAYEDWGLSPADTSALAEDRARECLQSLCHARHPNFVPKDKKKPAETHDGQSLSSGGKASSAGGGAKTTTVKTRTKAVGKPNGGAAGQASAAGTGSGTTPTVKTTTRPASQIDRNAFKAQREAFWKAEAKNNPGKYSPENLEKMRNGRAPTGPDGKPMELHHVDRTPDGGVRPMSRTEHRLGKNYKKNHP